MPQRTGGSAGAPGSTYSPGVLWPRDDLVVDVRRCEVAVQDRRVRLTPLEMGLLCILASAPGRVHTREDLAARLGTPAAPGSRAIDNIVVRLRRKLGDPPRAPVFIEAVWGVGYRLIDRARSPATLHAQLGATAFDALPVPALVLDADRAVVLVNAAARRWWGLRDGDAAGLPCADIVGCHTRAHPTLAARCPAARSLARGIAVRCTYLARRGRDGARAVDATYVPLPAPAGGPGFVLAVYRPHDPTARRRVAR
ncbi:MAG: winged helix-turn-helix domain-containing protein [Armatimonadota bacterium]|nr:winged helix-turn-helix domain-containing protein [Armatimonadota bacterium]